MRDYLINEYDLEEIILDIRQIINDDLSYTNMIRQFDPNADIQESFQLKMCQPLKRIYIYKAELDEDGARFSASKKKRKITLKSKRF